MNRVKKLTVNSMAAAVASVENFATDKDTDELELELILPVKEVLGLNICNALLWWILEHRCVNGMKKWRIITSTE